ncbi:MAG: EndoU domain-containing protein [Halanaerobiales bacterium]|nr:EndoU domain-containing protein [Halanaerobiales bacterium]
MSNSQKNVINWVALGADVGCMVLPGATGGGRAVKAIGKADDMIDVVKSAEKIDDVIDIAKGLRKVDPSTVINALSNFKGKKMIFGMDTFLLGKRGLKHILERHYLKYWDGSIKTVQSFFNKNMSIDNISDAIHHIMKQNRNILIEKGTKGRYQIEGTYSGINYIVGFKNGRVGQFYPKN